MILKIKRNYEFLARNKYILILLFQYVFFEINNYIWLKIDTYPLLWDAAAHFFDSLRIFELLKKNGLNFIFQIPGINREYPIFVPLITASFYKITGISEDMAVFINGSIFLGILMFSVYGITKNIYNKNPGLLAAFLVAVYPIIFGHSRIFMYDLPLTAMVCLGIYSYQVSDNFRKIGGSIIFGIVLGLGMLTKFPFFVFIASALSCYFFYEFYMIMYDSIKQRKPLLGILREHSGQIRNSLIALIIAIIIALTWYGQNLPYLSEILITIPQVYGAKYPSVFIPQSLSFYFFQLVNIQISFYLFIVFILGLWFFLKVRLKNKLFLIYWILIPYFVFTLINYKSTRYTLPYLPAIAIISSIGIFSIKRKILKVILVTSIVFIATIQFYIYSYGVKYLPPLLTFTIYGNPIYLFNQKGCENAMEQHRAPLRQDWKTTEILNSISKFIVKPNDQCLSVFIMQDDPRIHSPLLSLAFLKRKPINFAVGSWHYIADSKADLVITKDSNLMAPPYFMDKINRSVNWFEANIDKFSLVDKINLPDNSNLLIYKKN